MTAQFLAIAAGFAVATLMAWQDYRQARTAESLLSALLTFGLVLTIALGLTAQA